MIIFLMLSIKHSRCIAFCPSMPHSVFAGRNKLYQSGESREGDLESLREYDFFSVWLAVWLNKPSL